MAKSVLYFTEVCMVGITEYFNHMFHLDHLFVIRHFRNEKGAGAKMCPAIVSGIVTGDAPASYWLMFIPC